MNESIPPTRAIIGEYGQAGLPISAPIESAESTEALVRWRKDDDRAFFTLEFWHDVRGKWLEVPLVKALLILLALTSQLSAQLPSGPDLRVVRGDEGYPGLVGLAGLAPHGSDSRSLTLWSHGENEILLAFNLEVVNIGDEPWTPLTHPEQIYIDQRFTRPKLAVRGLFHFALSTTNGVVVAERTQDAAFFMWDVFPVLTVLPRNFGWFMPGISPGRAGSGWSPLQAETWLNIHGIPNGDYVLSVELDPLNIWGVYHRVEVGLTIENFNVRFR